MTCKRIDLNYKSNQVSVQLKEFNLSESSLLATSCPSQWNAGHGGEQVDTLPIWWKLATGSILSLHSTDRAPTILGRVSLRHDNFVSCTLRCLVLSALVQRSDWLCAHSAALFVAGSTLMLRGWVYLTCMLQREVIGVTWSQVCEPGGGENLLRQAPAPSHASTNTPTPSTWESPKLSKQAEIRHSERRDGRGHHHSRPHTVDTLLCNKNTLHDSKALWMTISVPVVECMLESLVCRIWCWWRIGFERGDFAVPFPTGAEMVGGVHCCFYPNWFI